MAQNVPNDTFRTEWHTSGEEYRVVEQSNACARSAGNPTSNNSSDDLREIPINEVELTTKKLGNGTYGDVYDAQWRNQSVAVKVSRQISASTSKDLLQEARLAKRLEHANIVRVLGVVSIDGGNGFLMEKADRGSLRSALDDENNKLSLSQKLSVSTGIVKGLEYIHSKQIIHRDLNPRNVLLFEIKSQLTAKIADFGLSIYATPFVTVSYPIGTPYYIAPELYEEGGYGLGVDMYSLSIVLYEVFSGQSIWDALRHLENEVQLMAFVTSGLRPEIPESFPAELRTVIESGWSANVALRSTLANFRDALCKLEASTRDANPTTSVDCNRSFLPRSE